MGDVVQTSTDVKVVDNNGMTDRVLAGEAIDRGDWVYKGTDRKYYKAESGDTSLKATVAGMALTIADADEYFVIAKDGALVDVGGPVAPGLTYYLSNTPGAMVRESGLFVEGNYVSLLGYGVTAETFRVQVKNTGVQVLAPTVSDTPPVAGNADIASGILDGSLGTMVWLGDSVLQNMGSAPNLWMTRAGIKGFGLGAGFYSAGTLSGVFAGTNPQNDFGDFTEGGGRWAEVAFSGGTSNASSSDTNNRMLEMARVGPRSGDVTTWYEADWDPSQHVWAFGYDWMTSVLATGDLKIRLPIRKHSGGTTVANEYFVLKRDSTVIATSGFVSTYAATETFEWVEATIPQGTDIAGGLNLEVRFKASTASENGKKSYWGARGEVYDPAATSGSLLHMFGQGGLTVDNYHNGTNWTDESMGLLGLINPDVVVIALGLNTSSGTGTGASIDFAADLALLVERLRGFSPTCKIVYWGLHGRYSEDPDYGGGGPEPYHTEGMYLAQQATADSVFINSCQLLPNSRILSGPYPYFFQFTNFPNGTYIHMGTVVENGGNLYSAKTSHDKTATVPGSDATNWALLGAYATFNNRHPKSTDLNPAFYDTLHPTLHGGYLLMQSFVDGLHLVKYASQAALNYLG